MRYIIGIDLGTTNCALSFVDTELPSLTLQHFSIPQITFPGRIESLPTLPSFCYLSSDGEWPPGTFHLPWKKEGGIIAGQFAKTQGAKVPTKLVQSAKSWLCNAAAARRDKILPVDAADMSKRLSPVEASTEYLIHLRDAWNSLKAKGNPSLELEEQEVILTVPASFDEVARSLTVEAASKAGFLHVTLVEEPQAAFYSWICQHENDWESRFKKGDTILVCDVGGGTTDFSTIEIEQAEKLAFKRTAVGQHLLLGGDNIDSALAHHIENKLKENGHPPLESFQWLQLQAEARAAKEALLKLNTPADATYSIVLQGSGSSVVGTTLSATIEKNEIEKLLLDGFFGVFSLENALQHKSRRGFRTMGLPYEDEPSITKQLARFLLQAGYLEKNKGIDYILFNGGTLKPEIFQKAIEDSLIKWFPATTLQRLFSFSLDLAVARGAAYYGKVRRGMGVAIGGGLPRTYYLKIDVAESCGTSIKALTLLERGTEEGAVFHPSFQFSLRPNIPVAFHLFTSSVRLNDRAGDLVDIDESEMQPLPPIQTILRFGRKQMTGDQEEVIPVKLGIALTVIGTIDLWLESLSTDHKWQLEFQLRSVEGIDTSFLQKEKIIDDETYEKGHADEAIQMIESLFSPINSQSPLFSPNSIFEKLEVKIGFPRKEWKTSLLRLLWKPLLKMAPSRKITLEHEARWWNLAGFFLRPGFGFAMDDFRMKELWKIFLSELKAVKSTECLIQMWICIRRLAGGFNKGQQIQLASDLIGPVLEKKTGKIEVKKKGDFYLYSEKIRALASLERLDIPFKIKIGNALIDRLVRDSCSIYDYWALGRIGARHLLYGTAAHVVPKEIASNWIDRILSIPPPSEREDAKIFLLKQLARKTDNRELNLPNSVIEKIILLYPQEDLVELLLKEKEWTQIEQEQAFGEGLPAGLILELDKCQI